MIDITARSTVKDGDKGTNVSAHIEGSGEEIVNEALIIIESIMKRLKEEAPTLHLIAIQAIADNPWILSGDKDEEEYNAMMANAMSKGILKGGVN